MMQFRSIYNADGELVELRVDQFDHEARIADQLLAEHDTRWMQVDDAGVTFTLTNGDARYTFVASHPEGRRLALNWAHYTKGATVG